MLINILEFDVRNLGLTWFEWIPNVGRQVTGNVTIQEPGKNLNAIKTVRVHTMIRYKN